LYEEDGLRIGELARRARLSKQTMTTMIRLLERDRLVRRRPDPDDRRATRVFLTPRARAFQPIAEATLLDLERLTRQTLSARATKQLTTALEQLINLNEHRDERD
jgi:DNA-binding MarR family transcriptional regulator